MRIVRGIGIALALLMLPKSANATITQIFDPVDLTGGPFTVEDFEDDVFDPVVLADVPLEVTGIGCIGGACTPATGLKISLENGGFQLFEDLPGFTPADAPTTVFADSGSDADFDSFAALLTNGVNDTFVLMTTVIPDGAGCCSTRRDLDYFASYGADLTGATISRIGLQLLSLTIDNVDGYEVGLNARIVVEGFVPEPGYSSLRVAAILSCFVTAAALQRRRPPDGTPESR